LLVGRAVQLLSGVITEMGARGTFLRARCLSSVRCLFASQRRRLGVSLIITVLRGVRLFRFPLYDLLLTVRPGVRAPPFPTRSASQHRASPAPKMSRFFRLLCGGLNAETSDTASLSGLVSRPQHSERRSGRESVPPHPLGLAERVNPSKATPPRPSRLRWRRGCSRATERPGRDPAGHVLGSGCSPVRGTTVT
jgi:hypothetical protein